MCIPVEIQPDMQTQVAHSFCSIPVQQKLVQLLAITVGVIANLRYLFYTFVGCHPAIPDVSARHLEKSEG